MFVRFKLGAFKFKKKNTKRLETSFNKINRHMFKFFLIFLSRNFTVLKELRHHLKGVNESEYRKMINLFLRSISGTWIYKKIKSVHVYKISDTPEELEKNLTFPPLILLGKIFGMSKRELALKQDYIIFRLRKVLFYYFLLYLILRPFMGKIIHFLVYSGIL